MCAPAEGWEGWTFTCAGSSLHPWVRDTALGARWPSWTGPEPRQALPTVPLPSPQPARQSSGTGSDMGDFSNDSLASDFLQWTKTRQLSHCLCTAVSGVLHTNGCSLSVCPLHMHGRSSADARLKDVQRRILYVLLTAGLPLVHVWPRAASSLNARKKLMHMSHHPPARRIQHEPKHY